MSSDAPTLPLADTVHAGVAPGAGVDLARGTAVGRYLVLEKLGEGGMGVVYAAYDSKLDRRVALKALRGQGAEQQESEGQSRLVREAQAMARLSHPNVVTVYDVVATGEQVLVAMELVEGQTLSAWLGKKARGWREVVGAFVQAGRGLAAAHAAGIVHRDFKVDNVFVGNDGRPRVGDFGLARVAGSARPGGSAGEDASPVLVSREGIAGTPAYMAYEQLLGAAADARSDQFSFCVALYEALYGERPFEGTTLVSLLSSLGEERVRPPRRGTGVPSRLRAILARGLKKRPEDRFLSMPELLAALEADPTVARRRGVVAGVVALAFVVGGAGVVRARRVESLACHAAAGQVEDAWNDRERRAVREAFEGSGRPYAADTLARTSRLLDAYAGAWSAGATAACERARGAESEALAFPRSQCLAGKLGDLSALVGVLTRADGEVVDRAVQAARALPDVAECAGNDPSRGRAWPSDPAVRAEAQALERQMSVVTALRQAGRYTEASELGGKALGEARRLGFAPMVADAVLAVAQSQRLAGSVKDAEAAFHRATVAAEAAGNARVAVLAWIGLAQLATERNDFALADERFDLAAAYENRIGVDDLLRGKLLLGRGDRLSDQGRTEEARPLHEKALAIFERLGSDEATAALNSLGVDSDLAGRFEEARGYYERALARYEQVLGPDHPSVARQLGNLGVMAADNKKYDEAAADLERSLRIFERALGPQNPSVGGALSNLASAYEGAKRFEDALPIAQRAVSVVEKGFGPESVDMAFADVALGGALDGLHRSAEAIAPLEGALVIWLRGGAPLDVAEGRFRLGKALLDAGRERDRARTLLGQARATFADEHKADRLAEIDEVLRARAAPGH